jgi:hypothetical protein
MPQFVPLCPTTVNKIRSEVIHNFVNAAEVVAMPANIDQNAIPAYSAFDFGE